MILDRGIANISRKQNTAPPGAKPIYTDVPYWESWYGELEFETSPARPTNAREEVETGARVRVMQNRAINNHDRVTLSPVNGAPRPYEVTRAYHGRDDESGELITDLTLEEVSP